MAIHLHGDAKEGVGTIDLSKHATVADLLEDADEMVWIIDEDEPLEPSTLLAELSASRRHELVKHRCKKVNVSVTYNGIESVIRVTPARKIRAVIKKAIKVPEFAIDPSSASDLELRLPGSDEGLDSSLPVGRLVTNGRCEIALDLVPASRHAG